MGRREDKANLDERTQACIEKARALAETVPPIREGDGTEEFREYKGEGVDIICKDSAVTVFLNGFANPVLLVSSSGTILHVTEEAIATLESKL